MKENEALSVKEFSSEIIEKACENSHAHVFDHYRCVRDYRSRMSNFFKTLPGFKKKFYYSVTIEKHSGKPNTVQVRTSVAQKVGDGIPDLECNKNFPVMEAKQIGLKQQDDFEKKSSNTFRIDFPNARFR